MHNGSGHLYALLAPAGICSRRHGAPERRGMKRDGWLSRICLMHGDCHAGGLATSIGGIIGRYYKRNRHFDAREAGGARASSWRDDKYRFTWLRARSIMSAPNACWLHWRY